MMNRIIDFFIGSSFFLGIFLSIILLTVSFYKSKANTYLSVSIVIITIISLLGWLNPETGLLAMIRNIMWEFLFPVTILGYFLIQLNHPFFKSKYYKLLFLPFIITFIIDFILDLDFSMGLYKLPFTRDHFLIELFFMLEDHLALIYTSVILIWTFILIKKSSKNNRIRFWLLSINTTLLVILFFWFLFELEEIIFDTEELGSVIWFLISSFLWMILCYIIFKLQLTIEQNELKVINKDHKQKSNNNTSTSTNSINYIDKFITILEQQEAYKNPMLSRHDLATHLNISEGYLSQLVNNELKKSVVQIINEYRINEAKRMLSNTVYNKYSIEAIGLESGFKSKSAFYNSFKNSTNVSPGIYRKTKISA